MQLLHKVLIILIALLTVSVLIASVVLMIGMTYARFRTSKTGYINYRSTTTGVWMFAASGDVPAANGSGAFSEPTGWTTDSAGVYTLSFILANGKSSGAPVETDQNAAVEVYVTEGFEFADGASMTLTAGGVTYEGVPQQITEGSAAYKTYGHGRIYRFENAGQSMQLFFEGNTETFIPAVLTVSGVFEYPAAVTVTVTSRPLQ